MLLNAYYCASNLITSSKAEVEYADDCECCVEDGEDDEEVVEGCPHVSSGENDYRESVAKNTKQSGT